MQPRRETALLRLALLAGLVLTLTHPTISEAQDLVTLSGTVTDSLSGEPRPGLRVTALDASGEALDLQVTNSLGGFALRVPPGTYDLRVVYFSANDLVPGARDVVVGGVEVAGDRHLEVVVPPTYRVRVRVLDPDGEPASSVSVSGYTEPYSGLRPGRDGWVTIEAPAGEFTLYAVPFEGSELAREERLVRVTGDAELVIGLRRGFAVSGTVVDAAGAPVEGARVEYTVDLETGYTQTERDGRFRFVALADPAQYWIRVSPPASSVLYQREVPVLVDGDTEVEVALPYGEPTRHWSEVTHSRLPLSRVSGSHQDAAAGDLDDDGDMDLAVASGRDPHFILTNEGGGQFTYEGLPLEAYTGNSYVSHRIGLADLDGDWLLDVVVVSSDYRRHELVLNLGDGGFSEAGDLLPAYRPANAVALGDVDGDGDVDVAVGNGAGSISHPNSLFLNDGLARFEDASATHLPPRADDTRDLELADLDRDGDLDLLVGNQQDNALLLNDGAGRFAAAPAGALPLTELPEITNVVALEDVDGDGDLDALFVNGWPPVYPRPDTVATHRLLLNDGGGRFVDASQRLPAGLMISVDGNLVDLTGDGAPDVVMSSTLPAHRVFANSGTGWFEATDEVVLPAGMTGSGCRFAAADYDGDGVGDLFLPNTMGVDRLLLGRLPPTAVEEGSGEGAVPAAWALLQNYPNPLNAGTVIPLVLSRPGQVELSIFDVLGQRVRRLVRGDRRAGPHAVAWDGLDDEGRPAASGVYVYRLSAMGVRLERRMVMIR